MKLYEETINFSFLGSGYPLYFHYIKYCIIILAIITLTSGEYNILSNYFGDNCHDSIQDAANALLNKESRVCVKDWISVFTLANKYQ